MRRMRVMHVLNTGGYSGAENVVITIIKTMKSKVDGYYVSPKGKIEKILYENEIQYFPLNDDTVSLSSLRRAVNTIKPDIIHAHDFTAGVVSSLSVFGIPIINHLHNNSPWLKSFSIKSILYGVSALRYKRILTVSDAVMEEFIFGSLFSNKTKTVGNPIDLQGIREKADEAVVNESSDVVFLGRLSLQKKPLFFVKVISTLVALYPEIKVAMIGDGELRNEVESTIKDLKLQNNIKIYGFLDNPYGLLKNSKVMCMPSAWEGFGLAAVEALTFGKPVVAAPVGGLDDIITSGCGKKCNTHNEYVEEILRLLNDKEYYTIKSQGAFLRANRYDNIDSYRKMMISIYRSVL